MNEHTQAAPRLRPETAAELAAALFDGAAGAAELLLEVWNGADERRRDRARRALRALDPRRAPVADLADDVATLVLACVYATDRRERVRVAGLLQHLCAAAAELSGRYA